MLWARLAYGRQLKPLLIRRPVKLLLDAVCGSIAVLIAYLLRFDLVVPEAQRPQMWFWVAALFLLTPLGLSSFGGYHATWQHFGARDCGRLIVRLLGLCGLLFMINLLNPSHRVIPYSVALINLMLALALTTGLRMLRRLDHEALLRLTTTDQILIIGTGNTIASAVRQLHPLYGAGIAGAVIGGEDGAVKKLRIGGVAVLGDTRQLGQLISRHNVTLLFLCSADLRQMPEVMQVAAEMDVAVKLLPSVNDLLDNRVRVSKNLTVAGLRRQTDASAESLHPAVLECLRGRTVLITGAAGSIGSELVRQVANASVRRLLLLDQDENGVFELMNQLGQRGSTVPVIIDIRDSHAIRNLFERERPQVVLHAAAYKHVPLMECNPCEAVLNNVMGTRSLAEAAVEFGAERMVMISSDKAVHPSSIMGASKRLAEVVIQEQAAREQSRTQFACVRFGNVLGSRGSVLPIFLKQIEQGGPITVTHEQMTRYFMTIPQAVSLVLRAASLASCGHIYMLDMGDPVRIVAFAREVIQLSGLRPDKDIEIRIVGSRPGEKLHEQLWSEDADVTPTAFEHIFQVRAETADVQFPDLLARLEWAAREHDEDEVRELLRAMPIGYLTARSAALEPMTIG